MAISLDIAASEFGREGRYRLGLDRRLLDRDGMAELLLDWIARYPIVSIEDPFGEDDREGWIAFTRAAGTRVQIIGDDYLTTNAARVDAAARDRACNAVLIKPNQAGTVTETRAALQAGKAAGFGTIVSARSGETEDVAIVHLAVGWNAGQLKVGSFARSERMAKWNEGLRIEEAHRRRGAAGHTPRRVSRARCGAFRWRMLMPIEELLRARAKDLGGGLMVRRLLPSHPRQGVGPFVFFDHFGPITAQPDDNFDVRPHPHIGLATVTYLFDGAMLHRDSLGSVQRIEPGAINWMTAGRGIVHSERTPPDLRGQPHPMHGLQLWAALPKAHEECEPAFAHTPAAAIPEWRGDGVRVRVLIGEAFGARSPVKTFAPTLYLDVVAARGRAHWSCRASPPRSSARPTASTHPSSSTAARSRSTRSPCSRPASTRPSPRRAARAT